MTTSPLDPLFLPPPSPGSRETALGRLYRRSWLYNFLLRGRHPGQFTVIPRDPWAGDEDIGNAIFRGEYKFAGKSVKAPGMPIWDVEPANRDWQECAHNFQWLRHLRACGGQTAAGLAESSVRRWLEKFDRWHAVAWQPHVTAPRVIAWLQNARLVARTDDLVHHSKVLNSLARQLRHLRRSIDSAPAGIAQLHVLAALITGGLCLQGALRGTGRAVEALERLLEDQILNDGGYCSRNPGDQLAALLILIPLRDVLMASDHDGVVAVQKAIDRLCPMLRFFRHCDGGLAQFNGASASSSRLITEVLKQSRTRSQPPVTAPRMGYQRFAGEDTVLIMDTGAPPAKEVSGGAHAGCLSFELSAGKSRLIVNCGDGRAALANQNWRRVSRTSAAHSTLIFNDQNSASIRDNGQIERGPARVQSARSVSPGEIVIDSSHDGYRRRFGLTHRRKLTLNAEGTKIAGEDELTGTLSKKSRGRPIDIRFHLHPGVDASLVRGGEGVLLRPPSGDGWMFRAAGISAALEESVYLGDAGHIRRSEQIVISEALDETPFKVAWSLERISKD